MTEDLDKFLLPLRSLRDYTGQQDFDASKYKTVKRDDDEGDEEEDKGKQETSQSTLQNLATGMAVEEPSAEVVENALDVDFSSAEMRGKGKRLCSLERFLTEGADEKSLSHLFLFFDEASFSGLSVASKVLYVKLKHMKFTLSMTAKGFGIFSSNVRRGVGHGFVQDCAVACGGDGRVRMDTSCSINGANSIASFFTQAYPMKVAISHLQISLDASVNEIGMRSLMASLHSAHAGNLQCLNLEGSGVQTLGLTLLGDAMMAKKLPMLQELNISRNNAMYRGIHKIGEAIKGQYCPQLHTLDVSSNTANVAVLEFFSKSFAEYTPFLRHLKAANNEVDFADSDCVNRLMMGKLDIDNFESLDLSHNSLIDSVFTKLFLGQVWSIPSVASYSDEQRPVAKMKELVLDQCELGNKTMDHLSQLMLLGFLENLEHLHMGSNAITATGVESLLKPLRREMMRGMTKITLPLNTLYAEGMNLMMSAQTLGVFDHLEELDVSDCGCNKEVMALFGRAIMKRDDLGLLKLRKLRLFGNVPNARRQAKGIFPDEFIVKCGVC